MVRLPQQLPLRAGILSHWPWAGFREEKEQDRQRGRSPQCMWGVSVWGLNLRVEWMSRMRSVVLSSGCAWGSGPPVPVRAPRVALRCSRGWADPLMQTGWGLSYSLCLQVFQESLSSSGSHSVFAVLGPGDCFFVSLQLEFHFVHRCVLLDLRQVCEVGRLLECPRA